MKKIIYIFVFLLFTACSSNPPQWYNKIYSDNQDFIYATGSGNTKEEAINSALANASAKVAIVVKSLYKSLKYSYNGNDTATYSDNTILDIETKTNPLIFTDYKILKISKKDKYYVLLKINRYKNAKYMCDNTDIENINDNYLNLLFNYKKIIKKLNNKIERLKTINALYPLCKEKLKNAFKKKKQLEKKYNLLTLNINSKNKKIKEIIESVLNIKISPNAAINIFADTKNEYKKVGNYKIVIIDLYLKIKNKNERKNLSLKCAGSSIQDYNTAKELAFRECKIKLKRIFNNY